MSVADSVFRIGIYRSPFNLKIKKRTELNTSNSCIYRKFLTKTQKQENTLRRVLNGEEKLNFVKTSVSWISSKDIMNTCFVLNYGFEAALPWPQVYI